MKAEEMKEKRIVEFKDLLILVDESERKKQYVE